MKLEFDFGRISTIEFGVGLDDGDKQSFQLIPIDKSVQTALVEVAQTTWGEMQDQDANPPMYEPSEKYSSTEYVYLPLDDELSTRIRDLHGAKNLPMDAGALDNPEEVFCYFARLTDKTGSRAICLRRSTQFKGLLRTRLIRFVTDALKLVEDDVFKIDRDFDLIADAKNIHILRPSGFEFAGELQEAILASVPGNIKSIERDLDFVDFDPISAYASSRPRAARYLASIRSQKETKNIDRSALKKLCKITGVEIHEKNGKLSVGDKDVMGFLEVLDRRRYEIELIKASPERFRAGSRRKL